MAMPVAGATVTFTAPAGGASATLSSATALTNALGVASVIATANNIAGSYLVTASSGGLFDDLLADQSDAGPKLQSGIG